ncbi:MAG: putative transcriptional regulator [Cellvibrionaceae bacterium]|jgi:putative transcriptional regulator
MAFPSFKNHFLIAMPSLVDPMFHRAVTYVCEHHEHGAMGLVVNHPMKLTMKQLFEHLGIDTQASVSGKSLYNGGPIQKKRGFVLHTSDKSWESTIALTEDISLTSSKDILEDIAGNRGPERAIVAMGCAGWDSGQLETEILANSWLTVPVDHQILFDVPHKQRWQRAAQKLGIDVNLIVNQAGHA